MGNVGGTRNYGYGKQIAWAGKNALADRYGKGHFATKATHEERWNQFAQYLKKNGINDARKINKTVLQQYANYVSALVKGGDIKVAYGQNLLSSVNVVLQTMRKDKLLSIKPAQWVGHRANVRTTIPVTLERSGTVEPLRHLKNNGQQRIALIVDLTRTFGLRFREASLLNANRALKDAKRFKQINIIKGTKGGRGKGANRWVPVNKQQLTLLTQAAELENHHNSQNLMPPKQSYKQWRNQAYFAWRVATKEIPINGFHDMRAAYACERYQSITGFPAPVVTGQRQACKELDKQARAILSAELGHSRTDVIAAYIGSSK